MFCGNVPGTVRAYVGCVGQAQPAPGYGPAGPEVIARRFRASPGLAWVLGGAVVVLAAAAVVLAALAGQLSINITTGGVIVLTFAGVGLLIARRQPGNPIGRSASASGSCGTGCMTSTASSAGPWPTRW